MFFLQKMRVLANNINNILVYACNLKFVNINCVKELSCINF